MRSCHPKSSPDCVPCQGSGKSASCCANRPQSLVDAFIRECRNNLSVNGCDDEHACYYYCCRSFQCCCCRRYYWCCRCRYSGCFYDLSVPLMPLMSLILLILLIGSAGHVLDQTRDLLNQITYLLHISKHESQLSSTIRIGWTRTLETDRGDDSLLSCFIPSISILLLSLTLPYTSLDQRRSLVHTVRPY
jgi:hypothetical protein